MLEYKLAKEVYMSMESNLDKSKSNETYINVISSITGSAASQVDGVVSVTVIIKNKKLGDSHLPEIKLSMWSSTTTDWQKSKFPSIFIMAT